MIRARYATRPRRGALLLALLAWLAMAAFAPLAAATASAPAVVASDAHGMTGHAMAAPHAMAGMTLAGDPADACASASGHHGCGHGHEGAACPCGGLCAATLLAASFGLPPAGDLPRVQQRPGAVARAPFPPFPAPLRPPSA